MKRRKGSALQGLIGGALLGASMYKKHQDDTAAKSAKESSDYAASWNKNSTGGSSDAAWEPSPAADTAPTAEVIEEEYANGGMVGSHADYCYGKRRK